MSKVIEIPTLNWFESNPWAKVGNKYTGSIGATDISKNAFMFIINFYRKDEGNFLVADVYDSISQLEKPEEYTNRTFEATEQGRLDLIEWLEFQYSEFVEQGRNKLKINFNK